MLILDALVTQLTILELATKLPAMHLLLPNKGIIATILEIIIRFSNLLYLVDKPVQVIISLLMVEVSLTLYPLRKGTS
jgi:hypothetical protein